MTVDVIIPTYKPDQRFFELIALLDKQTFPISHIRIINTEEKYFEKIIYGRRYEEEYRNLCVTHISRREFDLIEFLITNANQVFDRERIYEAVWGYDAEGDSNVVKEHVRKIRAKLNEATGQDYIETIWGVGYKWKRQ